MHTKSTRLIYSVIALLVLILSTGICSADDVNVKFITRIGGQIQDVAIKDHYAYIGQGKDLVILDISNVSKPSEIGRLMTTSTVNTVIVAGNYTYITNAEGDLLIANISNPAAPTVSGSYDIDGYAQDAAVSGNYAYVTNNLYDDEYHGRLEIIDISNASAPTLIQSYDTVCWAHDIAASGNYVYIADGDCGLLILNITNPSAPTLTGSCDTGGGYAIAVSGNYAYIDDGDGLVIVDITDPSAPTIEGSYETVDGINAIAVTGNYAYIVSNFFTTNNYYVQLEIVDISNPAAPTLVGSEDIPSIPTYNAGETGYVAILGNYAYIADYYNGLLVLDISTPSSPKLESKYDIACDTSDVAVSDNYAYIADGINGLEIFDVSNPSAPELIGKCETNGSARSIILSGDYAYITTLTDTGNDYSLVIVDVSNPSLPSIVGKYDNEGLLMNLDVAGNYAYITDGYNNLSIVNVANPSSPTLAGKYETKGPTHNVIVSGKYAYVIVYDFSDPDFAFSDLLILDITNASSPKYIGNCEHRNDDEDMIDVSVSGNYVYVSIGSQIFGNGHLDILDVSIPSSPKYIGGYEGDVGDFTISGNYIYLDLGWDNGLSIVDISDPSSPTIAGGYYLGGWANDIEVSGNYVYLSDNNRALTILQVNTAPTSTVSYAPVYDNRLRASSPNTVLSTSTYIDVGKSTSSSRDVMWFNLSDYKKTDKISKAILSLYWYYPVGSTRTADTVVEVYRPMQWDPQYVSWNKRLSGISWTTAGGNWYDKNGIAEGTTPYASVTFKASKVPDDKYYDFDVTQLIQEYVNETYENTGFFLKAKTEGGNYIAFYSSDWSIAAQKPKLTVTRVSDNSPVAEAGPDKTVTTGEVVVFNGSASTDDNGIVSYSWDFDDSDGITSEATGVAVNKTYATAGNYTVTLTVTDTIGQKSSDTLKVVVTSSTSTVSYAPDYDNRLRASSPNTVLSSSTYIDVGKSTSSSRDVLLFDLSAYKPTDIISKATLSLYWYYPAGATRTSDTIVEVYRPVEWDSKYVTWNTRMPGVPWNTAGGNWYDKNGVAQGTTPYASATFKASTVPDNKYYDFDVTQLVQEYVNETYVNTGFFLKAKTESGNYIAFYSSDWSNSDQKPKLTVTMTSVPDEPPVDEVNVEFVSHFNGEIFDVALGANYAYVINTTYSDEDVSPDTLKIVNITDPSSPKLVGSFTTDGDASDVAVSENYAYIAKLQSGFEIVDVTDPSSPTLVGSYDTAPWITVPEISDIVVWDNYAYLVCADAGLEIVDITNAASPTLKGRYGTGETVWGVAVEENYVYLALDSGIVILDVSNPSLPQLVSDYNTTDRATDVVILGDYAYVTTYDGGLVILDINDPSSITLAGSYDTGKEFALNVAVENNYAYLAVAYGDDDLMVVNVTDPSMPRFASSFDTAGTIWEIAASGNYAYIANGDNGLVVLRVDSGQTTVSYSPDYDNRLRASSPNTVLSTTTYIDVGKSTSSSRDVLLFDLSAYKPTDTISKATLSLYWYYPPSATRTSDTVVEVYRPVEWDQKYVTWNTRMSGVPWTTAGGDWYDKNGVAQGTTPYASTTFKASTVPDNKYYEFDVTKLVQEYVNETYPNTGFFLKAKTESGNYIAFYSSDWSDAAQKPKLTITR